MILIVLIPLFVAIVLVTGALLFAFIGLIYSVSSDPIESDILDPNHSLWRWFKRF